MPGSFDLNPVPASVAQQALPILVAEYDEEAGQYTILPNVRCLRIDFRAGPEPPVARFQYMQDDLLQASVGWPSQFEQLFPIDAQGNYVVMTDDRLVVLTQDPNGNPIVLFDGFAQVPQADVQGSAQGGAQGVTFVALGVAIRLWDKPITGRIQRDTSNVEVVDGSADVRVPLPSRFNPSDSSVGAVGGYIGNATTSATTVGDNTYPVFVDPLVNERGDFDAQYWFVSDALSYLIVHEPSPLDFADNPYVIYPTISSLKALLSCEAPPDNGMLNSGDAVSADVNIRDYDASNKSPADVFAELLRYCGFIMAFDTQTGSSGFPQTSLVVMRRDALSSVTPKLIYLASSGVTSLDLASNNATGIHLARDCNSIVNQWTVETALKQVEITVALAPGFQPASGDDSPANITKWYSSNLTNATDKSRRMYRWYVADECADGHWNADTSTWVTGHAIDFTPVFPSDSKGLATYVDRYRPGSHTLIAKDANGKPLKAILQISAPNTSTDPQIRPVGANDSDFLTITKGWSLLDDRLGIEITGEDPNTWHTGMEKMATGASIPTIRGVSWQASPTGSGNQPFALFLTTVIEADRRIDRKNVIASKRGASPTQFARERSADGKDHFQYCTIDPSSIYYATQKDAKGNPSDGTNPLVCRDDTAAALTHSQQLRAAHEFPTLAGSVMIPFITDYYGIADRIQIVQGRNASLQINVGVDQGETPTYPWVTAFSWDFQGDRQQTVLQLSDRRAEPQAV